MTSLQQFFEEIAAEYKEAEKAPERSAPKPYCRFHLFDLVDDVCPQCAEDKERGYQVQMLAGRCANGSERDSGTRWHALREGEYKAICGATYGRRSAGWSSYIQLHQPVTCPRCLKKLQKADSKKEYSNAKETK